MAGWLSGDLFPTKLSFVVFIAYMGLFINQGILVTASRDKSNKYTYNPTTAVLLSEVLKMFAATILYLKDNPSLSTMCSEIRSNLKVFMLYFVPSILYALYNNLAFTNLQAYDPTTYYLLLQFRVVVTGIVFQLLFKKQLSKIQWFSLLLLTCGCIIKEVHFDSKGSSTTEASSASSMWSYINVHLVLILVQVFCSCFAGVYNEFLLKDTGYGIHIMLQNFFMYFDSIICNIIFLGFKGDLSVAFTGENIASIMQWKVIAIVINNAAIGIVTSLFLRNLNSILKTFASALELMFTAILCWIIFNIPIDVYTVVAIFVVSAATLLYARHPVVNRPSKEVEEELKKSESIEKSGTV